jgi:hypothetical protein
MTAGASPLLHLLLQLLLLLLQLRHSSCQVTRQRGQVLGKQAAADAAAALHWSESFSLILLQ